MLQRKKLRSVAPRVGVGCKRAFVVHGKDGMDEITTTTSTRISELKDGRVRTYEFCPLDIVGDYATLSDLAGGEPAVNAGIVRQILAGEKGAPRDIVCLNAAAGIVAGGKADSLPEAWALAQDSVDSGRARQALEIKRTSPIFVQPTNQVFVVWFFITEAIAKPLGTQQAAALRSASGSDL